MRPHASVRESLAETALMAGVVPLVVDPPGRALPDALRREITHRRGYCSWTVDHASWVVTLHSPEEHEFSGRTLEEALA